MRVPAKCVICGEDGFLYEIRDGAQHQPGYAVPERRRECGLCEPCGDLLGSGWAMVQPLGVSLV